MYWIVASALLMLMGITREVRAQVAPAGWGIRGSLGVDSRVGTGHTLEAHVRKHQWLLGSGYSVFESNGIHGDGDNSDDDFIEVVQVKSGVALHEGEAVFRGMLGAAFATHFLLNDGAAIKKGLGFSTEVHAGWLFEKNLGLSISLAGLYTFSRLFVHATMGFEFGQLR